MRFRVSFADDRVRVYWRRNEKLTQSCVQERDSFGGGSVMVWAGIMDKEHNYFVVVLSNLNAEAYVNILRNNLLPFIQNRIGVRE
jgi:expansin (peptidoglycan-binding protein)